MEKSHFSTGEILSKSWGVFKEKWGQVFGVGALYLVLSSIASSIPAAFQNSDSQVVMVALSLVSQLIALFLSIGVMKVMLAIVRRQEVKVTDMFGGGQYLLQYFLGSLVVGVITFVGFLLLIVPGIIWSLKYMFVYFLIIDEGLDFSKAMKESELMTQGIKWQLLGFGLVMGLVNIVGMIPLFLGLLITVPVTSLASFVLYDHLRSQRQTVESVVVETPVVTPVATPTTPEIPAPPQTPV